MSAESPRTSVLLLLPALLVVGCLFIGGLGFGVLQSVGLWSPVDVDGPTLRFYADLLRAPDVAWSLALTCYVAGTATFLSLALGMAFALLLRRASCGSALLRVIVQLPLPVPHLVAAIGVALLLAQSGLLARVLHAWGLLDAPAAMPPLVYDRAAIGIILTYVWKETPFMTLIALAALQSTAGELEQAARSLGASWWQTLRHVTLPLIAPALLGAAMIVFAFTFSAFEVPLLLGQSYPRMLAVEAFQRYNAPNLQLRPVALALNTCIAACTALALLPYLWLRRHADARVLAYGGTAVGGYSLAPSAHSRLRWLWPAALLAMTLWTLLPLAPLPAWSFSAGWRWPALVPEAWNMRTWRYLLAPATRALPALGTSLTLALVVTLLALVVGTPAALALGRRRFRGRMLAEVLLVAPLLVPPLSVAMGLQIVFIHLALADTFLGVALAHLVFALPYVVLILANANPVLDPCYEQQARSLGANTWRAFWYVTLPLLRPALTVAALMAFLVSWSQYAPTLLIGGGRVFTLPVLMVALARGSDTALTAAMALLLVAPTVVFLAIAAHRLDERRANDQLSRLEARTTTQRAIPSHGLHNEQVQL